jgi:hypothetical protein
VKKFKLWFNDSYIEVESWQDFFILSKTIPKFNHYNITLNKKVPTSYSSFYRYKILFYIYRNLNMIFLLMVY